MLIEQHVEYFGTIHKNLLILNLIHISGNGDS